MQVTETQFNPAEGGKQRGKMDCYDTENRKDSGFSTAASGSHGVIRCLLLSISQFRCHPVPAPVSDRLLPEVAAWPSAHISPSHLRFQEPQQQGESFFLPVTPTKVPQP